MRIAQIQNQVFDDIEKTIQELDNQIKTIKENVDILCLPEMFCCPYDIHKFDQYIQTKQSIAYAYCQQLAIRKKCLVSAGSMPEMEDGKLYNTAYVFDSNGNQITKHRKMHLFDIDVKNGQYFKESEVLTAGDQITTFQALGTTFGLCICYDMRFPELTRCMVDKGAKIIIAPAAFNQTTGPAHWNLVFQSQALNQQVFTVGTAPANNKEASYHSYGHSILCNPWGQVCNELNDQVGIQITTIDLSFVDSIRKQLPLLAHRRKDVYSLEEKK